jgi:hypothetical protein
LDYFHTAFHKANVDRVFTLLWFQLSDGPGTIRDRLTVSLGDLIFVSPWSPIGSDNYLPKDMFYDFATFAFVECSGENIMLTDVKLYFLAGLALAGGAALITSRLSDETRDSMEDVLPRWQHLIFFIDYFNLLEKSLLMVYSLGVLYQAI